MNPINAIPTPRSSQERQLGTFSRSPLKPAAKRTQTDNGSALVGLSAEAKDTSLITRLVSLIGHLLFGNTNSTTQSSGYTAAQLPPLPQTKQSSNGAGTQARIPNWLISQPNIREHGTTVSWSHYDQPIESSASVTEARVPVFSELGRPRSELHGNSRRWGDATGTTQTAVIDEIVSQASLRGWSTKQVAFALAVARVESGFNPDAAAKSTSASGIGQLIDRTAESLGLLSSERFSVPQNVSAMLSLIDQNRKIAHRLTGTGLETPAGLALQYGLYHDGPGLKYGGEKIARDRVLPWVERIYQWLTKPPIAVPK